MLMSAEMRWFWQDDCPLRPWFADLGPSPFEESRVDEYLVQPGESEIGIKRRGETCSVEIKGLVDRCECRWVQLAPHFELWCKWSLDAPPLELSETVIIRKVRWLRKFGNAGSGLIEIPLRPKGAPLTGDQMTKPSCNMEITKVEIADDPRPWWTFGIEAFGDLKSAPRNLDMMAQFLFDRALPLPVCGTFFNYPAWLARRPRSSRDA